MFSGDKAYSGFAVAGVPSAKQFYSDTLGLDVSEEYGLLKITIGGGAEVLVSAPTRPRPRDVHRPELPRRGTSPR